MSKSKAYHRAMGQFVGGLLTTVIIATVMVFLDPIRGDGANWRNLAWWVTTVILGSFVWGLMAALQYHNEKAIDPDDTK